MTEDQGTEERYVDVYIFGIPEDAWLYFKEIEKLYGSRVTAFQALLDSFDRERVIGELITKIDRLNQRIEELEQTKKTNKIKTFGGEI